MSQGGSPETAAGLTRRQRRAAERALRKDQGAWFPRWFWPSFAFPAIVWQALFFILAFYVVLSVAFGGVDFFRNPEPTFQPWWWDLATFQATLGKIFGGDVTDVYLRTFAYIAMASTLCLLIGYPIAYFVARHSGRRKPLYLALLIAPFWISYLMRMFAWQSLLEKGGFVDDILGLLPFVSGPVGFLEGKHITVILGLVYGYVPYMILPIFGQLDRIHPALLEGGRDLGASPTQTFFRVTLPLSKPAIFAGLIIVTLPMFGDYYTTELLSGSPKNTMIGSIIDLTYVTPGQGPEGASFVLTLVVMLVFPMIWYLRYTAKAAAEK